MATLGHVAVGLAAARWSSTLEDRAASRRRDAVLLAGLALLPDADVVAFAFGVPYAAPFGHRGAAHSLLVGALVGVAAGWIWRRPRFGVAAAIATMSHGLLDAVTDGGLGIALLWPFTDARFFFPWHPLPVAPIGVGMLSLRGLHVLGVELVIFSPLWIYAAWPRRCTGTLAPPS